MPQVCSICTHLHLAEIDAALVAGATLRDITGRFPGLSKSAISRHRQHVADTIAAAQQVFQIEHGGNLNDQISAAKAEVLAVLDAARGKDPKIVLAAVGKLQGLLELLAKVEGKLRDGATINLTVSPEWASTRAIILQALEPHPEARLAVAAALQSAMVPHAGA